GYRQIVVRDGKGAKDRVTMLPQSVHEALERHLIGVRALHERDLAAGYGTVELPHALARKYPRAPCEWAWKFVFPSHKLSTDPRTGALQRHHVYENYVIRGVKEAARGAHRQARQLSHLAAFLCDASAGKRIRHPHCAGAARPRRCLHDDDLHA